MPTGTPYDSFVLPYRIRVDDFSDSIIQNIIPALHLLSHTHSDHINGLSSKSFGYTVVCSHDAKEMLLRHEVYGERALHEMELRAEKKRTYSHLKVDPLVQPDGSLYYTGSRDLLRPLPLNTPTVIELYDNEVVTITLFDANHCPGAVMFLIEGNRGSVLHTGDFRAEPWFLDSITRNPLLQPYLAPDTPFPPSNSAYTQRVDDTTSITKALDTIYLDTASLLSPLVVPTKERATTGLVELMKLFPSDVFFFINSWTWGYEDILKAISRAFRSKIHVDRYKHSIYTHISDPFLRLIVTRDPASTRFHACERFQRCEYVDVENPPPETVSRMGKRVVYINPVNMGSVSWDLYLAETKSKLNHGEIVNNLLVPLSRHSPLSELRSFVALFRPQRIVPNTLVPGLHGLDWVCMDTMFADCLSHSRHLSGGSPNIKREHLEFQLDDATDVAIANLIGHGAADTAERWAESGKLKKKLDFLLSYLSPDERDIVLGKTNIEERKDSRMPVQQNSLIRGQRAGQQDKISTRYGESDEDSDCDDEDERGRTAHKLFAALAGIETKESQWGLSPSSMSQSLSLEEAIQGISPVAGKVQNRELQSQVVPGNRLTPASSPIKHIERPDKGKKRQLDSPLPRATTKRVLFPPCRPTTNPSICSRLGQSIPLADVNNCLAEQLSSRTPNASSQSMLEPANKRRKTELLFESQARSPELRAIEDGFIAPLPALQQDQLSMHFSASPSSPELLVLQPRSLDLKSPGRGSAQTGSHENNPVPSPRSPSSREERRLLRAERLKIAEKLSQARPDLVIPSYQEIRDRQRSWYVKHQTKEQYLAGIRSSSSFYISPQKRKVFSFKTVDDDDEGMDWERSRLLAQQVAADLASGRRPMLPHLSCTDSQIEPH